MYAELKDIKLGFGGETVLDGISVQVHESDRIGLIGVNGAGKTTLLNILTGGLKPDEGTVWHSERLACGYLKQNSGLTGGSTVWKEMRSVFADVIKAQKELENISEQMQQAPDDTSLQNGYAKTLAFIEAHGGYHIDVNIKKILNGMGFYAQDYDKGIDTLSGGEKTRLALARLLLQNPQLLILDEPTNHLDMGTLLWLEDYLAGYKGALLIVSHDRYFLDKVTNKIWELEDHEVTQYKGNYSAYKVQKAERLETRMKEYKKQSRQIAHMEDYIQKNMVRASTATRAKSRVHQLAHMEVLKKPKTHTKVPSFSFVFDKKTGVEVLQAEDVELAVGEQRRILAQDVSFEVRRGEKVAILGDNGTGKTTLLKTLDGRLRPVKGDIVWGTGVNKGYYDQENKDFDEKNNVLQELQGRFASMLEYDARSMLGRVLLTGDDVFKPVAALSGGERAKLGFAILMAGRHNVLLLDEPTNHLDLAARESLEEALCKYEGTLLFVSHDRYFIRALAGRIMEFQDEAVYGYDSGYDAFIEQKKLAAEPAGLMGDNMGVLQADKDDLPVANRKQERQRQAAQRQMVSDLEKEINALEEEEKIVAQEIEQNPTDHMLLHEKCARMEEIKARLEQLTEKWLELV